jgi:hypothetical protein
MCIVVVVHVILDTRKTIDLMLLPSCERYGLDDFLDEAARQVLSSAPLPFSHSICSILQRPCNASMTFLDSEDAP